MRFALIAVGILLIGCCLALVSSRAASAAEPQPSAQATDPGADPGALFDRLDTEHKGALSAGQLPPDKRGLFERLLRLAGKPADGQLTRAEFVAQLKSIAESPPSVEAPAGNAPFSNPASGSSESATAKTAAAKTAAAKTAKSDETPRAHAAARRVDPAIMFDRLDKSHKRKLNVDDVPEPRQRLFKRLLREAGKPEGGSLTKQEFVKAVDAILAKGQRVGGGKAAGAGKKNAAASAGQTFDVDTLVSRLMQRSTRADGKLTKADLPERMQARFDKIDENHDGLIDQSELRTWLAKVKRQLAAAKALGLGASAGANGSSPTKRGSEK